MCGAPGIGKPIKTNETPYKLWDDKNSENVAKANLKDRFMKTFQYKQNKVKSSASFILPKVKVIEAERNTHMQETNLIKSSTFSFQNSRKLNIKQVQYLPLQESSTKHDFSKLVSAHKHSEQPAIYEQVKKVPTNLPPSSRFIHTFLSGSNLRM